MGVAGQSSIHMRSYKELDSHLKFGFKHEMIKCRLQRDTYLERRPNGSIVKSQDHAHEQLMRHLLEIRDIPTFNQAVDSFAKDREKLVELKRMLEEQMLEIKGQLPGLYLADSPQLDAEQAKEVRARIHRAETAKSYVIRRMAKVDTLLSRLNKEGGWLMWVETWEGQTTGHGWVATKLHPAEWLVNELTLYEKEAREISFSVPITQQQWDRLPPSVTKYQ